MVVGILCRKNHFNPPHQRYCNACGASLVCSRQRLSTCRRPPLGILVRDDGAAFRLDSKIVIVDDRTTVGAGAGITLESPVGRAIRVEVYLRGWQVFVTDHGSELAVTVRGIDGRELALQSSGPLELTPGAVLNIGSRSLVFHSSFDPPSGAAPFS